MPTKAVCPNCGLMGTAPDEAVGRSVKCRGCNHSFVVGGTAPAKRKVDPGPAAPSPSPRAARTPMSSANVPEEAPIVFRCPKCGSKMESPSRMAGQKIDCRLPGCGQRLQIPAISAVPDPDNRTVQRRQHQVGNFAPIGRQYRYLERGQPSGPLSLKQMQERVATSQLHRQDLVWVEGTPDWVAAEQISELFAKIPVAVVLARTADEPLVPVEDLGLAPYLTPMDRNQNRRAPRSHDDDDEPTPARSRMKCSDFSLSRDFGRICWGATLWLNLLRAASAGLVWGIVMYLNLPHDRQHERQLAFLMPIALPVGYLFIYLPIGLICAYLSQRGLPWLGLFAIFLALGILAGDPLVFILHKVFPRAVPVERFGLLHFKMVMWVFDPSYNAQSASATPRPARRQQITPSALLGVFLLCCLVLACTSVAFYWFGGTMVLRDGPILPPVAGNNNLKDSAKINIPPTDTKAEIVKKSNPQPLPVITEFQGWDLEVTDSENKVVLLRRVDKLRAHGGHGVMWIQGLEWDMVNTVDVKLVKGNSGAIDSQFMVEAHLKNGATRTATWGGVLMETAWLKGQTDSGGREIVFSAVRRIVVLGKSQMADAGVAPKKQDIDLEDQRFKTQWTFLHPASYSGQVWVQMEPKLENRDKAHEYTIRWGTWEYSSVLNFKDRKTINLLHTKRADGSSIPIVFNISPACDVKFGQGKVAGYSQDINFGWKQVAGSKF